MEIIDRFQIKNRVRVNLGSTSGSKSSPRRRVSIVRAAFLASFMVWAYWYAPQLFQLQKKADMAVANVAGVAGVNIGGDPVVSVKFGAGETQRLALVDMDAVVVGFEDDVESKKGLVLVSRPVMGDRGVMAKEVTLGTKLDLEALKVALEVIRLGDLLGTGIGKEIAAIKVDKSKKIVLVLKDSSEAWLSSDYLGLGLRNLWLVLNRSEGRRAGRYLDARFKGAVYLGGG